MTEHETVAYDFQANGVRDVVQAFQTVEQTMLRAEKVSIESARREALKRLDFARDSAKKRVETERKAFQQLTVEESVGLGRSQAIANARDELAKRSAAKRKQAEVDLYKELDRIAEEHTRKAAEEAKKQERIARDLAARRKQLTEKISGITVGAVGSTVGAMARWGGAALTLGGALSVTNAAQSYMSAESAAVGLANSMFNPGDEEQRAWLKKNGKNGRFDDKAILALAAKGQALSGFGKDALATGWQDYVAKSADWKAIATPEGQQTLLDLAKLAKATGSDIGQVMSAAGSLRVQNQNLTPGEMMEMMRAIVGQGKMGAVEMKDLASVASTVTAGSGSYAMDQKKAQQALLGLSQIAIQTSSSPAEAATSVARFGTDVQGHAKQMKALGIDPIADKKTGALKAPSEILAEIFEKTQGNSSKFGEGKGNVGLGRESVRIANALMPVYRSAVETAKAKGETDDKKLARIGADAVRKEVQKYEHAGYNQKDIDEDFKRVMGTTQERFSVVTAELSEKLEMRVVPFLEKLAVAVERGAPRIDQLMDSFARLATYMVENPFKGIGAIVGAAVAKDLASEAVKKAAEKALATSLGQAGVIAGTAYITAQVGQIVIDELFKEHSDKTSKEIGGAASAFAEAKGLQRDALEGKMTPEKQKRLAQLRDEMAAQVQSDTENLNTRSWAERIGWLSGGDSGLGKLLGADGDEAERYQAERNAKLKQSQDALDELNKAISMTARHMREFTNDGNPSSPFHPSRKGSLTSPERK